jgi:hypothetical protein
MRWVVIRIQMIGEFIGVLVWCVGGYFIYICADNTNEYGGGGS